MPDRYPDHTPTRDTPHPRGTHGPHGPQPSASTAFPAEPGRGNKLRILIATLAVVAVCAAAVTIGRAATTKQNPAGPVQLVIVAGATATGKAAETTGTAETTAPSTTAPATTPTAPLPAGGFVNTGGGGQGQGSNNNPPVTHTSPPPAKTQPTTVSIGGEVTCQSGKSVEGVWISTTNGSGYAPWEGVSVSGQAFGSTSKYWYTLPQNEAYSVHVGCGGTQSAWAVQCYGPQVSDGTNNNFYCEDEDAPNHDCVAA